LEAVLTGRRGNPAMLRTTTDGSHSPRFRGSKCEKCFGEFSLQSSDDGGKKDNLQNDSCTDSMDAEGRKNGPILGEHGEVSAGPLARLVRRSYRMNECSHPL